MASSSSSRPVITVKQEHKTGDSVITVNQQHQTGDSFITVKQERQTGDSVITVKHERQTGDSVITVKQEHETGDVLITMKQQQHPTDDSFITVKVVDQAGDEYYFRIRRDKPLQKLKTKYRELARMEDYHNFRFIFKGRAIGDDDNDKTVNDIGLKDGDRIDVMLHQIGD